MVVTKPYGFTVEQINMSCPEDLQPYIDSYVYEEKLLDRRAWFNGQYLLSAVSVAVEHNLAGRKAKSKYIDTPLLHNALENYGLTQEEIDNRELQKMLMYEDEWARCDKARGLPETKFL